MDFRLATASVLALSIAAAIPAGPAAARGGDAIVGGIIGGIIGGAIAHESQKSRAQPKKVVRAAPDPMRESRRDVQRSLNYFGFPAGTPDGVYGRNTRTAISNFQASLGYPITGELTAFQQDFLVSSWKRAELGGATTLAMIAQNPNGAAGLLVTWRDEMAGIAPQQPPAGMMAAAPGTLAPGGGVPFLPQQPGVAAAPGGAPADAGLPTLAGQSAAPAGLPSFLSAAPAQASLTSHCNQVSMVTGTNGGFATLASMTDPGQALDEQFCLARTYAITDGETLARGLQGVTPAQLVDACAAVGPQMAGPVALLASQSPATVLAAAAEVAAESGQAPAQLAGTARICLSSGYRTDDMGVALGSALLLASLGQLPYGELVGQHVLKGFGTGANQNLARDWFRLGLDSIAHGQPAVFVPGQPERISLVRALALGERPEPQPVPAGAGAAPSNAPAVSNRLPGFKINN